ncbi:MAG TPA: hypothetical protein VIV60_10930, partial [Polyangiaceae bacterium]
PDPDPAKPTPLITIELSSGEGFVHLTRPLKWETRNSERLTADGIVVLRAIAKELRLHQDWSAVVGIRPSNNRPEDYQLAAARSAYLVTALRRLTLRDSSAQSGLFPEVARAPHASTSGIGILFVNRSKRAGERTPKATPETASPASTTGSPPDSATKAPSPMPPASESKSPPTPSR